MKLFEILFFQFFLNCIEVLNLLVINAIIIIFLFFSFLIDFVFLTNFGIKFFEFVFSYFENLFFYYVDYKSVFLPLLNKDTRFGIFDFLNNTSFNLFFFNFFILHILLSFSFCKIFLFSFFYYLFSFFFIDFFFFILLQLKFSFTFLFFFNIIFFSKKVLIFLYLLFFFFTGFFITFYYFFIFSFIYLLLFFFFFLFSYFFKTSLEYHVKELNFFSSHHVIIENSEMWTNYHLFCFDNQKLNAYLYRQKLNLKINIKQRQVFFTLLEVFFDLPLLVKDPEVQKLLVLIEHFVKEKNYVGEKDLVVQLLRERFMYTREFMEIKIQNKDISAFEVDVDPRELDVRPSKETKQNIHYQYRHDLTSEAMRRQKIQNFVPLSRTLIKNKFKLEDSIVTTPIINSSDSLYKFKNFVKYKHFLEKDKSTNLFYKDSYFFMFFHIDFLRRISSFYKKMIDYNKIDTMTPIGFQKQTKYYLNDNITMLEMYKLLHYFFFIVSERKTDFFSDIKQTRRLLKLKEKFGPIIFNDLMQVSDHKQARNVRVRLNSDLEFENVLLKLEEDINMVSKNLLSETQTITYKGKESKIILDTSEDEQLLKDFFRDLLYLYNFYLKKKKD
jgi:hypothetical protein